MKESDEDARLVGALVGEKHRGLYFNSAVFHDAIQRLAYLLPLWIDAIAAEASEGDVRRLAEVERLMNERPLLHVPKDRQL